MIRLPPRSTRTDTLFPYTTLFRSACGRHHRQEPHGAGRQEDPGAVVILEGGVRRDRGDAQPGGRQPEAGAVRVHLGRPEARPPAARSEEHTSELQSLMRISYAVFCLKKHNK